MIIVNPSSSIVQYTVDLVHHHDTERIEQPAKDAVQTDRVFDIETVRIERNEPVYVGGRCVVVLCAPSSPVMMSINRS